MAQVQPKDPAGAEKLFAEARKLLDDGKYAEACQKLADSHQLDPALGTLLNLAQCYAKIGKTATAWATYREAADTAHASGRADRETKARRAAEALEPDLAKFMITVPDAAAQKAVEVKRNGMPVPKGLWGVSEPVDPGEYLIEAHIPGGKSWTARVKAEPGRVAVVVLPPLEDAAAAPPEATGPSSASARIGAVPETRTIDHASGSFQRIAGFSAIGVGVVGLALGTVFGLKVSRKNDEIDTICPTGQPCPADGVVRYNTAVDDAKGVRTVSLVGFGAGAALVGVGAALVLTAPKSEAPSTALWFQPAMGTAGAGAAVGGSW
jgi:hypothetical protein